MATNNSLANRDKPKFSVAIQSDAYKNLINSTLNDPKRAGRFISAITSAVAVNPALQECEAGTILSAGLLGEALNLSPSPQLGQYYLVPFNDNKRGCKVASFQLGYKGYLQLAIRSGQYKKINVLSIKEGELKHFDPMTEDIEVELIEDEDARENAPTMGYYVMFEYINGFRKAMYWSREKMMAHADKYSKAFNRADYERVQKGEVAKGDMWKYSSYWYSDFDGMAAKTMLRQIISKWGIMSTEMQTAIQYDQGVGIIKDGKISGVEYVDNDDSVHATQPVVVESSDLPFESDDPLK